MFFSSRRREWTRDRWRTGESRGFQQLVVGFSSLCCERPTHSLRRLDFGWRWKRCRWRTRTPKGELRFRKVAVFRSLALYTLLSIAIKKTGLISNTLMPFCIIWTYIDALSYNSESLPFLRCCLMEPWFSCPLWLKTTVKMSMPKSTDAQLLMFTDQFSLRMFMLEQVIKSFRFPSFSIIHIHESVQISAPSTKDLGEEFHTYSEWEEKSRASSDSVDFSVEEFTASDVSRFHVRAFLKELIWLLGALYILFAFMILQICRVHVRHLFGEGTGASSSIILEIRCRTSFEMRVLILLVRCNSFVYLRVSSTMMKR